MQTHRKGGTGEKDGEWRGRARRGAAEEMVGREKAGREAGEKQWGLQCQGMADQEGGGGTRKKGRWGVGAMDGKHAPR